MITLQMGGLTLKRGPGRGSRATAVPGTVQMPTEHLLGAFMEPTSE